MGLKENLYHYTSTTSRACIHNYTIFIGRALTFGPEFLIYMLWLDDYAVCSILVFGVARRKVVSSTAYQVRTTQSRVPSVPVFGFKFKDPSPVHVRKQTFRSINWGSRWTPIRRILLPYKTVPCGTVQSNSPHYLQKYPGSVVLLLQRATTSRLPVVGAVCWGTTHCWSK